MPTRKGMALLMFALVALSYAALQWQTGAYTPQPGVLHTYLPSWLGPGKWVAAGLVAVWSAFQSDPRRLRWGFYGLVAVCTFRAASYAAAEITWFISDGEAGLSYAWASVIQYTAFAALLITLAGPDDGTVKVAEESSTPTDGTGSEDVH